eukprot:6164956-Amphidinium_carterae.1
MAEEDKKQYVTVTGEGLTIHGWKQVTPHHNAGELRRCQCTLGTLGLTRPQQEQQGDIPHWDPSVHREAQSDNWT